MRKIVFMMFVFATSLLTGFTPEKDHAGFLKALADMRAARWMLQHVPNDKWKVSEDEKTAIKCIDDAIGEIKKATIDDGKDINDHPKADEINEHKDRLTKAEEYLHKAHEDIKPEDKDFGNKLRDKVATHIDQAVAAIIRAKELK